MLLGWILLVWVQNFSLLISLLLRLLRQALFELKFLPAEAEAKSSRLCLSRHDACLPKSGKQETVSNFFPLHKICSDN